MKTKLAFLVLLCVLFVSCTPTTRTQEDKIVELKTEEVATEESAVTEEPTETPIACVTLLAPVNNVEIPPVGKVTFAWTPMDEAGRYVLNVILPTGDVVPFETDQTFRDQYMEAFVFGGEYQWEVVAQDANGSEICISEASTFEKAAYENPNSSNHGGDGSGTGNTGESNNGTGNTGDFNDGTGNTGDFNDGSGNTGESNNGSGNTGGFNDGSGNTGDFNDGSGNTGDFNSGAGGLGGGEIVAGIVGSVAVIVLGWRYWRKNWQR